VFAADWRQSKCGKIPIPVKKSISLFDVALLIFNYRIKQILQ
jgi:hypothetical protein